MKKATLLLIMLTLFFTVVLSACDNDSIEQSVINDAEQNSINNAEPISITRYYHVQSFNFDFDERTQGRFFMHQNQLHLYTLLEIGTESGDSEFALITFDADVSNKRELFRTVLDENVDFFDIRGFDKHDNGYISLVTHDFVVNYPHTREDVFASEESIEGTGNYVYRRISPTGEIVSVLNIDAINNDERHIFIFEIAFDLDGNAVASVWWFPADFDFSATGGIIPQGVRGESFLLFDNGITGDFREVDREVFLSGLFFNRTHDGQVIAPSVRWNPYSDITMFYMVDFENTAVVEGPKIKAESSIDSISGVFPALETSLFDFYFIDNEQRLFGYRKPDGSLTKLINFIELGINLDTRLDRYGFLQWSDGRITVVTRHRNSSLRREEITLYLLTPSDEPWRADEPEREVITLGGIDVNMSPLIDQVIEFNRTSTTHRVEVVNYTREDMDRLRTELITGRGPDVFMLSWWGSDLVAALAEGFFILDLYEKIDADPILNRNDFFPSILSTWENSRGELVQIAPDFSIQSIMGMQSVFPSAPDSWTYADFISFYQESREAGYPYPLGQTLDRFLILEKLLFTDDTFFSERNGTANFDSQAFIDVLNFAMTIPADQGWESVAHLAQIGQWDPISNLVNGEQLLLPFANINHLMHFRTLQARLGGITAFGFPSNDAPTHAVQVSSGTAMGIRANSPHVDAAWEFVRLSLLPDTSHDGNTFPMRVDLFEQLIYEELNRAEPATVFGGGNEHELPPMTEADAELLRELIANIGHKPVNDHPIQHIVNEDIAAFFAGNRTAEDTARIIQSRVGIFLAERAR